ncbi:LexA family protein [Streptomyces tauricus]
MVSRRPAYLTEREEQILACIRRSIAERGEGPTMVEIGAAVGLRSKGTVAYHLRNLQERGVLARDGRGWRSYRPAR